MRSVDFIYKYPQLITMLYNVKYHMDVKNKDFPIAITGDEGLGKTTFVLHLYEFWYNVLMERKVTAEDIVNINVNRMLWVKRFKVLKELDMNVNDEGADGLSSKEAIKRFGRNIEKLYKVFRKKKFFSPILIPDYFDLPKYFRKRVRMLIWVNKEGQFKVYTKEGVKWLNALNINKEPKSMEVARPFYTGVFPLYEGVLLKPYEEMAHSGVDTILDEVIADDGSKPDRLRAVDVYRKKVIELHEKGWGQNQIREELRTSNATIVKILKEYKGEKVY